jgi:DNA-binding protein YbaB
VASSGNAEQDRTDALIGLLSDAIGEWRERMKNLVFTGSDDDEVVVTHDSDGRLIECWIEPGLQQQLSLEELEIKVNEAIAGNAQRAQRGFDEAFEEMTAQLERPPFTQLLRHPVAEEMAAALHKATGGKS